MTSHSTYPNQITSYDLLKSFAVIIMIIDHLGYYFFPEELWWRAIGRIGFPVWFFLVGHASGRSIPWKLSGGALLLILFDYICNLPIFPFNALVTIIIIRILIDPVMNFSLKSRWHIWGVFAFLFIWIIPSMLVVEYGTLGLLTAMFGYLVRHREKLVEKFGNDKLVLEFMLFAYLSFIAVMQVWFQLSITEFLFMAIGTFFVRLYLYAKFDKESYPKLTEKLPSIITYGLQYMGRQTLEIYVIHLIIFQTIAVFYLNMPHLYE